MRIVLDECIPRRLRHEFPGHDVTTVVALGLGGTRNGELLLQLSAAGHEVLVTVDQNLRFQQRLVGLPLAIIVMRATSNAREDLLPLVPATLAAVQAIRPGEIVEIGP